jgi:hypothetical protein
MPGFLLRSWLCVMHRVARRRAARIVRKDSFWPVPSYGLREAHSPNLVEKLSEKPQTRLQRGPAGHQRGAFRSISSSVYLPNPRSERCSYPFSDSFGRGVLRSSRLGPVGGIMLTVAGIVTR